LKNIFVFIIAEQNVKKTFAIGRVLRVYVFIVLPSVL